MIMNTRCSAPSCRCDTPCWIWCGPQESDGTPVYDLEPDPEWVSVDLTQVDPCDPLDYGTFLAPTDFVVSS